LSIITVYVDEYLYCCSAHLFPVSLSMSDSLQIIHYTVLAFLCYLLGDVAPKGGGDCAELEDY